MEHDSACGDSLASWHGPIISDNRSNVNEKDTRPLYRPPTVSNSLVPKPRRVVDAEAVHASLPLPPSAQRAPPITSGRPVPARVRVQGARDLRLGTAIPVSPGHSFRATTYQIGDGTEQGRGNGEMLGFARDLYRRSDSPQQAMTVYSEADLPTYYKLADEFCTCERWFAAHPGPTWPNRFATLMGSIPELENFHMDDPRIGYLKDRNIFDALNGARVDWRLFESDLSIIRMFEPSSFANSARSYMSSIVAAVTFR